MQLLSILTSPLLATLFISAAAAQEFLELDNAPDLKVEVLKSVQCTRSTIAGDVIKVHYRGTLQSDGSEFDNSHTLGKPIQFQLGKHQVIEGWDLGLLDMCIGEQRRLAIPSQYAYGQSNIPGIPAGSTLMFDTELMAIQGVGELTEVTQNEDEDTEQHVEKEKPGDCELLGPFALLVQGALGVLALLSLVFKRWRETPRRPVKIWAFDASKQVVGSVLLHVANLFMSMLSSGSFDLAAKTKEAIQDSQPNPCSYYLLNLAIDTTIGIPILVILLKLLHHGFSLTPLARPPQSIKSGHYGNPPRWTWWAKQSLIYFIGLMGMKLCVFFIFQILPWIAWVGDWALRWTEGNQALQITFVMFVFPLIMNAMQYYIIDIFIKEPNGSAEYEQVNSDEDDVDGRPQDEIDWENDGESVDEAVFENSPLTGGKGVLKEASSTAVPARDGMGSSGSSDKRRNEAGGKQD